MDPTYCDRYSCCILELSKGPNSVYLWIRIHRYMLIHKKSREICAELNLQCSISIWTAACGKICWSHLSLACPPWMSRQFGILSWRPVVNQSLKNGVYTYTPTTEEQWVPEGKASSISNRMICSNHDAQENSKKVDGANRKKWERNIYLLLPKHFLFIITCLYKMSSMRTKQVRISWGLE